jgi:flagellar biosynthesis protein FlhF
VSSELLAQAGVATEDDRSSWNPTAPLGNAPDTTEAVAAELAETAAAQLSAPTDMEQMTAELAEIRTIVEQLAVERVDGVIDQSPAPLRWLRQRFRDQGLKSTIAAAVLQQIADAQVATSNADGLRRTVARQLATMLPAAPHLDLARRPALIALVGPAGAGKTTLAMKLAVEVERAYSLNVIVAGTDVERAGAPQQFTAVGAAAGVQTRLCYTPGELQALINEGVADVVIVDTAGHDGTRRDRMTELQTFIHASRQREVLLTLPATLKTGDMERLTAAFAPLEPLGVALTRCDDTATMGEPLSALVDGGLGLVFTTHSDSVADAPQPGDNLGLAQAVLTGEWNHSNLPSDRAA